MPSKTTLLRPFQAFSKALRVGKSRLAPIFTVTDAATIAGRRSPSWAAFLSFLWPGLGQLYLRSRRTAAIFVLPTIPLLLLLAYALRRGPLPFATQLFADRVVGVTTVALLLVFGALRLTAVAHAYFQSRRGQGRRTMQRAVFGVLVLAILSSHLAGGAVLLAVSNAGSQVFNPASMVARTEPFVSLAPGATPTAVHAPAITKRITILLTGVDSGPEAGRAGQLLYDSMMVVSFDPTANSVQMISVPRDATNFPLYFGGIRKYPHKLNELASDVRAGTYSPEAGPNDDTKGYATIVNEVQYLVGVHIDYTAKMDLSQFVSLIDLVGGITVNNPTAICDCAYPGWPGYDWMDGSPYGFSLPAGNQHLDGRHALAYVRSRHNSGDSDWGRQSRQQQVLLALLKQMTSLDQLPNLLNVINKLPQLMTTDLPPSLASDLVADYTQNSPTISQVVLDGTYFNGYIGSASCLNYNKIADLSRQLFGDDSQWTGKADPPPTCG